MTYEIIQTDAIKNWSKQDALSYLSYCSTDMIETTFQGHCATITVAPCRVHGVFAVYINGAFHGSLNTHQAAEEILNLLAYDHHGRGKRVRREVLRAATGRMDGQPNVGDYADAAVSRAVSSFCQLFGI